MELRLTAGGLWLTSSADARSRDGSHVGSVVGWEVRESAALVRIHGTRAERAALISIATEAMVGTLRRQTLAPLLLAVLRVTPATGAATVGLLAAGVMLGLAGTIERKGQEADLAALKEGIHRTREAAMTIGMEVAAEINRGIATTGETETSGGIEETATATATVTVTAIGGIGTAMVDASVTGGKGFKGAAPLCLEIFFCFFPIFSLAVSSCVCT